MTTSQRLAIELDKAGRSFLTKLLRQRKKRMLRAGATFSCQELVKVGNRFVNCDVEYNFEHLVKIFVRRDNGEAFSKKMRWCHEN